MKTLMSICLILSFISGTIFGDTFGSGDNQFEIDFVTISGDSGDLGNWLGNDGYTFSGVNHGDYRMGTYEITNDQWNKFKNEYGTVYGNPTDAYDSESSWTGTNLPTNNVSWYEAAQLVNWLNVSTNHAPAYKFTGTQGTGDYTFVPWDVADVGYDASNPYRNSNAYYFLPTQEEWVKAAYWNGTNLQTWATVGDVAPTAGVDTNYDNVLEQPWDVGSGSEELNGTFNMMGNITEWMEGPFNSGDYLSDIRCLRGGYFNDPQSYLHFYSRGSGGGFHEVGFVGFRVASVPEPATLLLLGMGGLLIRKRK